MSTLSQVFGSLDSMSQQQLLTLFVAATAYASAQGRLLPDGARRATLPIAAAAVAAFGLQSTEWTYAALLVGFAVAGLGCFALAVWATSTLLGIDRQSLALIVEQPSTQVPSTTPVAASAPARGGAPARRPAHSI